MKTTLEQELGKQLPNEKTFEGVKSFEAYRAAEAFCAELGYSVGRMQREAPVGIKQGNTWDIHKWRNLSPTDRRTLDGAIVGFDKRNGPVTVFYV